MSRQLQRAAIRLLGIGARRPGHGWAAIALLVAISGGCASPISSPVPSRNEIDLPTLPTRPAGQAMSCAGVGLADGILHGAATAPDPVWIETQGIQPRRVAVRWPAGFRAWFAPELELIGAGGEIVAREGDTLSGIGGSQGPDGRFGLWEFNGRRYPC